MEQQDCNQVPLSDEVLMDRREAAKFLKCNLVTLWRYTRENRLPYYRVGKKMFFRKSEILSTMRVK